MAWKTLKPMASRFATPAISINSGGKLSWTKVVAEAMGHPEQVEVLYDSQKQRLGIRAATNGEAVRVHVKERSISAKGMLVAEGIWDRLELPLTGIPALLDEAEGIWAISIRSDGPFSKRGRRKAVADDDELESPPY